MITDVQTFSTDGFWVVPAGAYASAEVSVDLIAPGGGGGSGRSATAAVCGGGGGGQGGGRSKRVFIKSDLPGTVAVAIGAVGTGGASVAHTNNGNAGAAGGNVSFGAYLSATGGAGGAGGTDSGNAAGGTGAGVGSTANGKDGGRGGASGSPALFTGTGGDSVSGEGTGGGGGGAGTTSGMINHTAGGNGGAGENGLTGGTGGAAAAGSGLPGGDATNGQSSVSSTIIEAGGAGGGGGGGRGAAGGASGTSGSWGAGGAGSPGRSVASGGTSDAGKSGAGGYCVVTTTYELVARVRSVARGRSVARSRSTNRRAVPAIRWGLVSYWGLNDLLDTYGNNFLSNVGGATFTPGKLTNAVLLNGTDQYLRAANNSSLQTGDVDYWIAAWVKLNSVGVNQAIATKWATQNEWYLQQTNEGGNLFRFIAQASFLRIVDATNFGSISAGVWYFLFAYHDAVNNRIGISVNNGTANTNTTTGAQNSSNDNVVIGAQDDNLAFLGGQVDAVAFGKNPPGGLAALLTEIPTVLYNGGLGNEYPWG